MKCFVAAVMLTAASAAAAAAGESCDYGKAHPDAPPEMSQYAFLIGDYRIEARAWRDGSWTEGFQAARWNGRYILGGMAIMDEWFDSPPDEDPSTIRGVNIRMYNPETERWHLMWQYTKDKAVTELSSKVETDGKMHLDWVPPKPDRKIWFEVYGPGHWARLDHRKNEKTGKFEPKYKLEAFRVPCKE